MADACARDVMTAPVLSVRRHWPVARAAELMVRYGFTALPVVDEGERLVGLLTEGDVLVDRLGADASAGHTVADVMTVDVLAVSPQLELARLTERPVSGGRRVIPIVDGGRLVGIVSRRDLIRTAAERP